MTFLQLVRDKSTAPDPSTFLVHLKSPFAGTGGGDVVVVGQVKAKSNHVSIAEKSEARVSQQDVRIKVQAISINNQHVEVC